MKKTTTYLLTGIISLLASCSSEENTTADGDNGRTPITLSARLDGMTRAANDLQGSTFAVDKVGVSIKGSDDTYLADNKQFLIASDGTLTDPDEVKYYFPTNGTTLSVYAYAPYNATAMPASFEVKADQSLDDDYIASDILYGLPSNGNPISHLNGGNNVVLDFKHKCAKIVVTLTPGEGFTKADLEGSVLTTGKVYTKMDLTAATDGSCMATGSKTAVKLATYSENNGNPTYDVDGKLTTAAVLVPQTVAAGSILFVLTFPESSSTMPLYLTLPSALTLTEGKVYHLDITANRSALSLKGELGITDWNDVNKGSEELAERLPINLNDLTSDFTVTRDMTITGTTSYKVTIANGVCVILDDATINNQIVCEGNATIYLKGTNKVTCNTQYYAGIQAGSSGTTLTIGGEGLLEVTGGYWAAGIGGGMSNSMSCGDITITGGTVSATGGDQGAGIGSGYSTCGDITITGGTVTATGGYSAAGIGSADMSSYCGAITITGGTITATGGNNGAGIGSGSSSSCGDITFNGVSDIIVKAGSRAACIGNGFKGYAGDIKVTGCTNVILDNSASNSSYFNPTPSDISGSTFYDEDDNDITNSITQN